MIEEIPYGSHVKKTAYVCDNAHFCEAPCGSGEVLNCQYCEKESWAQEDFCEYIKPKAHNCTKED